MLKARFVVKFRYSQFADGTQSPLLLKATRSGVSQYWQNFPSCMMLEMPFCRRYYSQVAEMHW